MRQVCKYVAEENEHLVVNNILPFNIHKPLNINVRVGIRPLSKDKGKQTKIMFYEGTSNQSIHFFNKNFPNYRFAVMNFANSHHVGGGYTSGAMAQEEELCRTIPDLYPSLDIDADQNHKYYNFKWWNTVKYLSNMSVYRYDNAQSDGKYDIFPSAPIQVSIISAAAPDLNRDAKQIDDFLLNMNKIFEEIKKVIYTCCMAPIFAIREKIEGVVNVLILGAFGCGAFAPSPEIQNILGIKYNEIIASLFIEVITTTPHLLTVYDYICFAIPQGDNYDAFKNMFVLNNINISEQTT